MPFFHLLDTIDTLWEYLIPNWYTYEYQYCITWFDIAKLEVEKLTHVLPLLFLWSFF